MEEIRGIGEWLVGRGRVTREQVAEAHEAQIVYGGRFGTNLIELGAISLDDFADELAEHCGVPLPPKEWLENPEPEALAKLPVEHASRHTALPMRLEGDRLHVALLEPNSPRALLELGSVTGCSIETYVLPELRLVYALERHYGIARDPRLANLAKRIAVAPTAADLAGGGGTDEERERAELTIQPLLGDEELIDESAFSDLHQRLNEARDRAAGGPSPAALAAPGDETAPALEIDAPGAAPPAPASAESGSALALERALATAGDRDAVASAALQLARRHGRVAALFVVHRGMIMGFRAAGGALEERIDAIMVPVTADSAFARAAGTGEPFRGAPEAEGIDARLLRAMGRIDAPDFALLPIPIRGRVVNLLYVDGGDEPLAETSLAALAALARLVSRGYERLLVELER